MAYNWISYDLHRADPVVCRLVSQDRDVVDYRGDRS